MMPVDNSILKKPFSVLSGLLLLALIVQFSIMFVWFDRGHYEVHDMMAISRGKSSDDIHPSIDVNIPKVNNAAAVAAVHSRLQQKSSLTRSQHEGEDFSLSGGHNNNINRTAQLAEVKTDPPRHGPSEGKHNQNVALSRPNRTAELAKVKAAAVQPDPPKQGTMKESKKNQNQIVVRRRQQYQLRGRQTQNRRHPSEQISYGRLPLPSKKTTFQQLPAYPINHQKSPHEIIVGQEQSQEKVAALPTHAITACNDALWRTLETATLVLPNNETFVFTGDIHDLWLRDSAAQVHPLLLPRAILPNNNHDSTPNTQKYGSLVQSDPRLERIVSGLILKTARFIRYDPYANAFRQKADHEFNTFERDVLGRFGFIATWNYELDSGCYFVRMMYYFYCSFPSHPVFREKEVKEAVMIMIDVWIAEQRHEDDQFPEGELFDCYHCANDLPYRYNPKELTRDGKGSPTNSSAGLTWSGFRPSDDPCEFGYLIPANMFVVVVLGYVMELCETIWNDDELKKKANKLREEIHYGIQQHGIVEHPKYGKIYAYEVDGLGNYLLMDDANVPNLLSIPYIGYDYDEEVYANTKKFVLSVDNPNFHRGEFDRQKIEGLGSPHTSWIKKKHRAGRIPSNIWPMGLIMQGLVSNDINEKIDIVEMLLKSSAGTNHMHESFNANNPSEYSREWFCWADSLFAELVMSLSNECLEKIFTYQYMMSRLFSEV